jgi:hypothetical protein
VEFQPDAQTGLLEYAGLMLDLSGLLGRRVDLVSKNGPKPSIRESVLQEARVLYAREELYLRDIIEAAGHIGALLANADSPAFRCAASASSASLR